MTDATDVTPAEAPEKPRRGLLGLVLGLAGGVLLGGAGFYATWAGLVDPAGLLSHEAPAAEAELGDVSFVALDAIMISLPPGSSARHLRFTGQLEVEPAQAEAVTELMPRILDVLNTSARRRGARPGAAVVAGPAPRPDAAAGPGGDRRGHGARPADHGIRPELRGRGWTC
jgi:hypothetical protein